MPIFLRIGTYIFFFLLAAFLVKRKVLKRELASTLLWWVFYVGLPISVFYAITSTKIDPHMMIIPLISIFISACGGVFAIILSTILKLPYKITGVIVASTMIMNTSLSIPFFTAFYGTNGLAIISLFDLGNLLMIFTAVYFVTLRIGRIPLTGISLFEKIITMPTLWVIVISLVLSFAGFRVPSLLAPVFSYITFGIFVAVMFTLGLLFELKASHFPLIALGLTLRYILGFILGYIAVSLLHIEGLARVAVLIGAASPNGYTSLVYAKIAKLDIQLCSQLVSISLGLGIILIPILLVLIK